MVRETILLHGHIVDSLLLPKVLDVILQFGGTFELAAIQIGKTRKDLSSARITVQADSAERLAQIINEVQAHGAVVEEETDCRCASAPRDGVFPEDFYATTHLSTEVRLSGRWVPVGGIEMDLGVRVDCDGPYVYQASTVPMAEVNQGDQIVVGHEGVRVVPYERPATLDVFGFMADQVGTW